MALARSGQKGAALMVMLAILVLGAAWGLVSIANVPLNRTALQRQHNAKVLQEAKQALIGWVAHQAVQANEDDPGRFPCPQAWGDVDSSNEGRERATCILAPLPQRPAIGWLPWRSLGIPKPLDAAGEQLWYVVSPEWARPTSGANLVINSNAPPPALSLNGQPVVALLIAPGDAVNMQACGGVAARAQARTKMPPASDPDHFEYLECENAAAAVPFNFVNAGPAGSFNDQVLPITLADVLPAIEAAVAARFERDMAPQVRTAYSGGLWPAGQVLPFAAPFGDPAASNFQGAPVMSTGSASVVNGNATVTLSVAVTPSVAGRYLRLGSSPNAYRIAAHAAGTNTLTLSAPYPEATASAPYRIFAAEGLLPVTSSCAAGPRCDPAFVAWEGAATVTRISGGALHSYTCSAVAGPPSALNCTIRYSTGLLPYEPWIQVRLDATARNVGMALRQVDTAVSIAGATSQTVSAAAMNGDGSATLQFDARVDASPGGSLLATLGSLVCSLLGVIPACFENSITVPIAAFADHPVVDPGNATHNWFYRNNWHQVAYYAAAPNVTPSGPRLCVTGSTCLGAAFHAEDGRHRGLVLLTGRALAGQDRTIATPNNWLEAANNDGASPFTVRDPALMMNRSFNDRIAVIDKNP